MSTDAGSRIERLTREAYTAELADAGQRDAYLQPGYVEACALIEGGEPWYLGMAGAAGAGMVTCAQLVRDLPAATVEGLGAQASDRPLRDAVTPYGYGGPIALGADAPLSEFAAQFPAWASEHGIVTTFLRFHPLLGSARAAPTGTEVVPLVGTVAWQLAPAGERERDLEAGMHQRHRRLVRKARREGVDVEVSRGAARLGDFQDLYSTTMQRQHADEFYFFPNDYWHALATAFGDDLVFVTALKNGNPIAALLCLAGGPFLHYHLGATADEARGNGASNLCFLTAAQWGQLGGMTHLHLGGGVGGNRDELYDFKLRFNPEHGAIDASIGKLVCDVHRYAAIAGTRDTGGFFPPWRAPRVAASKG